MNEAEKFLVHCKMTCFGGSEKGKCSCKSPPDCALKLHPRYSSYREQAMERLCRHLDNACVMSDLIKRSDE